MGPIGTMSDLSHPTSVFHSAPYGQAGTVAMTGMRHMSWPIS